LRGAIYTRVSTDQGLEQDFNSLDAQREACEAYIKSFAGGFEMMAIGAFGASKSMVVTFSPYSGAWRPNPPMVDFGQLSVERAPNERGGVAI
jgi:hypothetical protein